MTQTTRDKLIFASAGLFRQKGYHGVGLAEILETAGVPKGSLYHHFPNGKQDLAMAAADWAAAGMAKIIDDSFSDASDYAEGATTLCHKLAKFFDLSGGWDGCPVSSILTDGPENEAFRDKVATSVDLWVRRIAAHAERLGLSPDDALARGEMLMIGIQGSWTLARARRSSDVIRRLPGRLLNP